MKNSRTCTLLRLVLFLPVLPLAALSRSAAEDPAALILESHGRVSIKRAGPYVEVGTYRILVEGKLGRPRTVLPDGTWLYPGYAVPRSSAWGTLVVRFSGGRVTELYLATPAVIAALHQSAAQALPTGLASLPGSP